MAQSNAASDSPEGRDLERLRREEEEALRQLGSDAEPDDDDDDDAQDDDPAADDDADGAADADDEEAQPDSAGDEDDEDDEDDPELEDEPESDEPPEVATAEAPQGKAQPTPVSQDDIEERPFRFRADGVERDVPGAIATKHGIVFPGDSFQRHVQPFLADRSAFARKEQDYRRQLAELDPELNENVIRAKAFAKVMDPILEAAEKGDDGPLRDFLLDSTTNAAKLRLQVENEVLRAQTKARTDRETTESQERQEAEFVESVETGIAQGLREVLKEASYSALGLDPERAYRALIRNWREYVFRPTAGDGSGLDPAQHALAVNLNAIREYLDPLADVVRKTRRASQQDRQRDQKRRRNDAATGKRRKKAPTAVSRQGSPAVGGRRPQRPKTKEEWEQSFYEEVRRADLEEDE